MTLKEATIRLECDGLQVGSVFVPPFQVRAGELIKLQFSPEQSRHIDGVLDALSRSSNRGPIRAAGSVVVPQLPLNRWALREIFHRERTCEWLTRKTGMPRDEAARQLNRVGVAADAPLCTLAGNPRWLLGLLAAMWQGPDVLIFQTIGLDATGTAKALRSVRDLQGDAGAVYLCAHDDFDLPDSEYAAVVTVGSPAPASLL